MKATNRQRKAHDRRLSSVYRIALTEDDAVQFNSMREAAELFLMEHDMPHEDIGVRKGHGARKGQLFVTFTNVSDTVRAYMCLKCLWPRKVHFGRQLWLTERQAIQQLDIHDAWLQLMDLDSKESFKWGARDQRRFRETHANTYDTQYSEYSARSLAPEGLLARTVEEESDESTMSDEDWNAVGHHSNAGNRDTPQR